MTTYPPPDYRKPLYDLEGSPLIPDLETVAKPTGWNVMDFSEWGERESDFVRHHQHLHYDDEDNQNKAHEIWRRTDHSTSDEEEEYIKTMHLDVPDDKRRSGKAVVQPRFTNGHSVKEDEPREFSIDFEDWLSKFGVEEVPIAKQRGDWSLIPKRRKRLILNHDDDVLKDF